MEDLATGPAPLTERVRLPDGTVTEVSRQGEWAHVRLPDGKEGRIRVSDLEAFLARPRIRPATTADVVAGFQRGFRRATWQLLGLLALIIAIMLALLVLMLVYGD